MPEIKINTKKIVDNFHIINDLCHKNGKELMVITKCIKSNEDILKEMIMNGVKSIGDTSAENLINIKYGIDKMLMKVSTRLTGFSDSDFNILYLSEMKILKHISQIAGNRVVKVMLPIEMGELREGIPFDEVVKFVSEAIKMKNIKLVGISGNFGCMAGLMPDKNKFELLVDVAEKVKKEVGFEFEIISVGGTIIFNHLIKGEISKKINHVRMGEGIFTGQNTSLNGKLDGLHDDAFILSGEIIELRYKDTNMKGEYGYNAFGDKLHKENRLVNKGMRKRAVVDFGFMTGRNEKIRALDEGVKIVGNSYDFTVVDIEESNVELQVGNWIDFYVDYNILSYAMMSSEIDKVFVK